MREGSGPLPTPARTSRSMHLPMRVGNSRTPAQSRTRPAASIRTPRPVSTLGPPATGAVRQPNGPDSRLPESGVRGNISGPPEAPSRPRPPARTALRTPGNSPPRSFLHSYVRFRRSAAWRLAPLSQSAAIRLVDHRGRKSSLPRSAPASSQRSAPRSAMPRLHANALVLDLGLR